MKSPCNYALKNRSCDKCKQYRIIFRIDAVGAGGHYDRGFYTGEDGCNGRICEFCVSLLKSVARLDFGEHKAIGIAVD